MKHAMDISSIELKFLQGLLIDAAERAPSASAELFASEFNIGRRIGRKFLYRQADVDRAHDLLKALNQSLVVQSESTDRAGASDRPNISEKSGTISPHADSIAFMVFNRDEAVAGPGYQVAAANEIEGIRANLVIIVENFETFRQLNRYGWVMDRLKSEGTTLAIFRGDTIYKLDDAKGCIERCIERNGCRVWGFHDFDPAGLHMSAVTPNLSEHLVPELNKLRSVVSEKKRSDLYYNNLSQYGSALDACAHPQVKELWDLMKRMQKGLPQEWMRDI